MQGLILDTNLNTVAVVDVFESLLWVDRYCGYGDFEIYMPANDVVLNNFQLEFYIWMKASNRIMIIEDRQITSDPENGDFLIVTGRSLESILERRVIWDYTELSGNFQTEMERLLNENIINPTDTDRQVPNLYFATSTDPLITELTIEAQLYRTDTLYNVISILCEVNNIGFQISLNDSGDFIFEFVAGVDRSYNQAVNSFVVFSSKFENLIGSNYFESTKALKNIAIVEGTNQIVVVSADSGLETGMARREVFVDATDVLDTVDSVPLENQTYLERLEERGEEELAKTRDITSFEGEIDATQLFKYGTDFFVGDIVQITNQYGLEARSRVIEVVRSQDLSGEFIYPTFRKEL